MSPTNDHTAEVRNLLQDGLIRFVPGDDRYAVDRNGRIFSRATKSILRRYSGQWRQLKQHVNSHGYLSAMLGARNLRNVHVVVAEAWLGPRPDRHQVRHLDGNKKNNRCENLAWGTPQENMADRLLHGTHHRGERSPRSRLRQVDVLEIRRMADRGDSRKKIAAALGVALGTVKSIAARCSWKWLPG